MIDNGASRTRQRFDRGHEAFRRTFPSIAAALGERPFYVCPLCLCVVTEEMLPTRPLTREDVPPKSVGGRRIVLTCKPCNDRAGHEIDWHARRELDFMNFVTRGDAEMRAHLRTASGRVPIQMKVSGSGIQAFFVPKAARQSETDAVLADFGRATLPNGWQDFEINLEFAAFSRPRAATSWLRSAYLAFFAALGYRFIVRPELDIVRDRIKNPESNTLQTFRVIQHNAVCEPALIRIDTPDVFRSYAMFYGRNVVFLPRYGDHEFYSRLAAHPSCDVQLSGPSYPGRIERCSCTT